MRKGFPFKAPVTLISKHPCGGVAPTATFFASKDCRTLGYKLNATNDNMEVKKELVAKSRNYNEALYGSEIILVIIIMDQEGFRRETSV